MSIDYLVAAGVADRIHRAARHLAELMTQAQELGVSTSFRIDPGPAGRFVAQVTTSLEIKPRSVSVVPDGRDAVGQEAVGVVRLFGEQDVTDVG